MAVDQPVRGKDREQTLADRADSTTDPALFPSLDDGVTLLDVDGDRVVSVL